MDWLNLAYPVLSFIFVRIAIFAFAKWASNNQIVWLVTGIVFAAFAIDSAIRLMAIAVIAPYWWLPYLVLIALVYVSFITIRKTLKNLKPINFAR